MITIVKSSDRLPEALRYARGIIEELDRQIEDCDWIEDPEGRMIREPGAYAAEKRELSNQLHQWELLARILTSAAPVVIPDRS